MGGAFGRAVASDCGSRGGEHTFDSGSAVSLLGNRLNQARASDFQLPNIICSALAPSAASQRLIPSFRLVSSTRSNPGPETHIDHTKGDIP